MQNYFFALADRLFAQLHGDEVLLCALSGEQSDFVRLNRAKIRQAGNVEQSTLTLTFIAQHKQTSATLELLHQEPDYLACSEAIKRLREQIALLPEDRFLNYATTLHSNETVIKHDLPTSDNAIDQIRHCAEKLDLVGIWASGTIYRGFANSLGQKNWHEQNSFNFDWSLYLNEDKAVKCGYAGFTWDNDTLAHKFRDAEQALKLLNRPAKTITPGQYRAYLSPNANRELLDIMSWGGFGLKSQKSQHTPLIKMINEGWELSDKFHLEEKHRNGLTPGFTQTGFKKPASVALIERGRYANCLVNPRSAKEFSAEVNCDHERPESLHLAAGALAQSSILKALDTGIYINNLWYCNFSDHNHCRITGMTRFACFWVEGGELVAPINVMRFDDSIYNIYGKHLIDFTADQETLLDASSYEQRSLNSYRLPGALVDDFTLTL